MSNCTESVSLLDQQVAAERNYTRRFVSVEPVGGGDGPAHRLDDMLKAQQAIDEANAALSSHMKRCGHCRQG